MKKKTSFNLSNWLKELFYFISYTEGNRFLNKIHVFKLLLILKKCNIIVIISTNSKSVWKNNFLTYFSE